jgi:hypothetical protein
VVAHADTEAAGNPPHKEAENQGLPGEEEESGKGAEVQADHYGGYAPVDGLVKSAVVLETSAEAHVQHNSITKGFGFAVQ